MGLNYKNNPSANFFVSFFPLLSIQLALIHLNVLETIDLLIFPSKTWQSTSALFPKCWQQWSSSLYHVMFWYFWENTQIKWVLKFKNTYAKIYIKGCSNPKFNWTSKSTDKRAKWKSTRQWSWQRVKSKNNVILSWHKWIHFQDFNNLWKQWVGARITWKDQRGGKE